MLHRRLLISIIVMMSNAFKSIGGFWRSGSVVGLSLLACTLGGLAGCDKAPAGPQQVTTQPVHGNAVIRGQVTLIGNPPTATNDPVTMNLVLLSADKGLRNVVVSIAANSEPLVTDAPPVKMDQIEYQFEPRVVAVQTGQKLTIHSSDHAIHNVRFIAKLNPSINDVMRQAGDWKVYTFAKPEQIGVKCDVHPWMSAWINVFDHPFFATTDAEGRFEIKGLKPGTYTLITWHELYGPQTHEVEIKSGSAPTEMNFTYTAP